jgi:hypothetical protein
VKVNFNKFQSTVNDLGLGHLDLNTDQIWIMLSNVGPVNTNQHDGDITEIAAGNGYSAGGQQIGSTSYGDVAGVGSLVGNAVTWTAGPGSMATFRYFVLYDKSVGAAGSHPLIGWWDFGSGVTLAAGQSLTIGSDSAGDNWTVGAPILTVS